MSDITSITELRALFPENNRRSMSKEYYEWKLRNNPYKEGMVFLERRQDVVVGSLTITPKRISIGGKVLTVAELGDAFTHPEYQKQGIFSRLLKACTAFTISQGIEVIYGTPNSNALPVEIKLGYRPCPFVKLNYMAKDQWNMRTTIRSIAKAILRRSYDPFSLDLSTIFKQTFSLPLFLRVKDSVTDQSFDILSINRFTEEIDGLWGVEGMVSLLSEIRLI